jgi:pimeloyl-ACP methyl ester carboxylesterase
VLSIFKNRARAPSLAKGLAVGLTVLGASALASAALAAKAEQDNPPIGKFIVVDGVKLHYVELGQGAPIVFLHGNGSMIQDFAGSGVLELAAKSHRVFAFDRPGFGHSERPEDRNWTAEAQAKLFHQAFVQLSIRKPVVVAHSWGTLVALELAVAFPQDVAHLILLSGYYYPSLRADTVLSLPGASPLLGRAIQHTVGPLIGWLAANATIEKMFKPLAVAPQFAAAYSRAMALRPSQLEAVSAETAMMPAMAAALVEHYEKLNMPVSIFAGECDDIIDTQAQSGRLHSALGQSRLHIESGVGHMVHYAIPHKIMSELAASAARPDDVPIQATVRKQQGR